MFTPSFCPRPPLPLPFSLYFPSSPSQNGHLECVKWLLEEAAVPLVVRDSGGETLLHYAAFHGQGKILEWLLERVRTTDDAADAGEVGCQGQDRVVRL